MIAPRSGQQFIAMGQVILSGAKVLTGATGTGPWVYSGQSQEIAPTSSPFCSIANEKCMRPENLYLDDVAQMHVMSRAFVMPGTSTWFFDYARDEIVLGADPAGHRVETSYLQHAFVAAGELPVYNVVINGLVIEKYANPAQTAVVHAPQGQGWTVSENVIRWNHATGVIISSNSAVTSNFMYDNGQMGISAFGADNLTIVNNSLFHNGLYFNPYWEAGGLKVLKTSNSLIRRNWVLGNYGFGLWMDYDCLNILVDDNTVEDNDESGIYAELSFEIRILSNRVYRNGRHHAFWVSAAGILVAESANVEVANNLVQDNAGGIFAWQQERGSSTIFPGTKWRLFNVNVHNNAVRMAEGYNGLAQVEGNTDYFWTMGNRFNGNTYTFQGGDLKFSWNEVNGLSFAEWQSYGLDAAGSTITYRPARHRR